MKIETLIYIKELLENKVTATRARKEYAYNMMREKEHKKGYSMWSKDEEIKDQNIIFWRNSYKTQKEKYQKAYDALEDFMDKKW